MKKVKTKKNPFFEGVMEGLNDALAIAEGRVDPATYKVHVPAHVDVKAIRTKLHMSQTEFAACYGFTAASVRDWEQKRYHPDGAVRAYLIVIDRKPEAVRDALALSTPKPKGERART